MKGADNKLAAIDDATDEELERAREKVKRKVELACASGHQPAAMFSLCPIADTLPLCGVRSFQSTHPGRIASEKLCKERAVDRRNPYEPDAGTPVLRLPAPLLQRHRRWLKAGLGYPRLQQ